MVLFMSQNELSFSLVIFSSSLIDILLRMNFLSLLLLLLLFLSS
jgi:hypothetical protein